jgi:hypothetical protein
MTPAITLEELLAWSQEASHFWKAHLNANPSLLELPCGIGGSTNVQEFVRHIWGVDLLWAQRAAGLPVIDRKTIPAGPLDLLYGLHLSAVEIFRTLLDDPAHNWEEAFTLDHPSVPPEMRAFSHRKLLGHALLHSQRHWAQLATLVRNAGFPSGYKGDLLFSQALA